MIYTCVVCGRPLHVGPDRGWRNWACDACATAYGLRKALSEWPLWAQALRQNDGALRESERERERAGIAVVCLSDCQWEELRDSADE